jgi:hypothetical protein
MMMFQFHIALALGLIALASGVALFGCSEKHSCSGFAKILGFFIVIMALFSTACTVYCGVTYWNKGAFSQCHMQTKQAMPAPDESMKKTAE